MDTTDDDAFNQFVARWKKKLRGISYKTGGEHQYADVVQEAWLMARTFRTAEGIALDLRNDTQQQLLLAHLYQHLVRYTELTVRHAARLDHAPRGFEDGKDIHPLARSLASNAGLNILDELVEREADNSRQATRQAHGSLAAAYVRLLRHFDHSMESVADHLRISVSYAYRRCAQARCFATYLQHISVPGRDALPGPWRRQRRIPAVILPGK